MTSIPTIALELSIVTISAITAAIWMQIYRRVNGPSRNMAFAILMIAIAVAAHALEEIGIMTNWLEPTVIIASIAAGAFWLDASFDIAEGKL